MTLSFQVPNSTVDDVKKSLKGVLTTDIPSFAKVDWDNDDLLVKIDKAGKSEFRIAVKADGGHVKIHETKRSVALLHKAFVGQVEGFVEKILSKIGAKRA